MEHIRLEPGRRYVVLADGTSLVWPVPVRGGWTYADRKLAVGEEVTFLDQRWGMGSDPGLEEWFLIGTTQGAFHPAGLWGGIREGLLAPAGEPPA